MRGQPEIYDELKKPASFAITPTAKAGLAKLSAARNISASELIEQIGRGIISLSDADSINYQTSLWQESNANKSEAPK
ncbi:hypothetical protein IQ264_27925 [Phormidium sp. LEGE 05292]|uniref:hypothetical protein n=1 Tax=[Phormidium] sp. LEGE 05292 TaxID=767427 RepID=UPI00187FBFB4|nr:hypothetical protein [Phormidium sp. LEGE 05292]MBE9229237.1 hypothetical protein [Phormidium sp. LEGE 05292]